MRSRGAEVPKERFMPHTHSSGVADFFFFAQESCKCKLDAVRHGRDFPTSFLPSFHLRHCHDSTRLVQLRASCGTPLQLYSEVRNYTEMVSLKTQKVFRFPRRSICQVPHKTEGGKTEHFTRFFHRTVSEDMRTSGLMRHSTHSVVPTGRSLKFMEPPAFLEPHMNRSKLSAARSDCYCRVHIVRGGTGRCDALCLLLQKSPPRSAGSTAEPLSPTPISSRPTRPPGRGSIKISRMQTDSDAHSAHPSILLLLLRNSSSASVV